MFKAILKVAINTIRIGIDIFEDILDDVEFYFTDPDFNIEGIPDDLLEELLFEEEIDKVNSKK